MAQPKPARDERRRLRDVDEEIAEEAVVLIPVYDLIRKIAQRLREEDESRGESQQR